ncbi:unnamed protein product, partial [Ectocarpus sp. 4 AP-2014]
MKEVAAAEANAELSNLRSELAKTQEQVQALHQSAATAEALADATPSLPPEPLPPSDATEAPAAETTTPSQDTSEEVNILQPVDYDGLVDRALSQEEEGLGELRRKAKDAGVTQRHCDKADKVFSDVVDCCGDGLSSVESILKGTKTIADEDASSIQEALAAALERAIASSSVLLKEALVGRIRACEAEKQVSLEQEAAEEERAKAAALSQEKTVLVDELQQHLVQVRMLRKEVGALRQEEMAEAAEGMHVQAAEANPPPQEEVIDDAAPPSPHAAAEEEPSPTVVADDTGTWRRRYEHLAGLLAEQTKQNSAMAGQLATSGRTRPSSSRRSSPRRRIVPPAETPLSLGTPTASPGERRPHSTGPSTAVSKNGGAKPRSPQRVNRSSNTSPRPPSPAIAEVSGQEARKGSRATLVSKGVSASNSPPPLVDIAATGGVSDVRVGASRKASVDSGVQVGGGPTQPVVETSDGGTQADYDGVAATNDADVAVSPVVALEQPSDSNNTESNNGNPAVEQPEPSKAPFFEAAETPSTVAAEDKSKGITAEEESNGTLQAQEVAEGLDNGAGQDGSAYTAAIMEETDGMVPAKRPETVEDPRGDGVLEAEREEQVAGSSIVETRKTKDTSATTK